MKTLVMIRHAHRNTEERSRDNGLSEKGDAQVKRLLPFVSERWKGAKPTFFSSPKKRCLQTLSPLAKAQGESLTIEARLDERGPLENDRDFLARLDEFLDAWKYEGPELTVVCSHGDVIPILIERLTKAQVGIKKAGYCEIEWVSGSAYLTWLVQKVS